MIHSFLIIGQSNMAGRGKLEEAQPLDKDKLLVLRNGRWQPMYRPVNNDRPFSGVCLAESFARLYADENNKDLLRIPIYFTLTQNRSWNSEKDIMRYLRACKFVQIRRASHLRRNGDFYEKSY